MNILAWVAALVTFSALYIAFSLVGREIGVPVSVDLDPFTVDYGRGAESEISSITTAFGWGVNIFCILAGVVAWHLVHRRSFTPNGTADFYGWLVGSLILIVGGAPLWKYFREPAMLGNLLELALFGLAIYIGMEVGKHFKSVAP